MIKGLYIWGVHLRQGTFGCLHTTTTAGPWSRSKKKQNSMSNQEEQLPSSFIVPPAPPTDMVKEKCLKGSGCIKAELVQKDQFGAEQ